MVAGEHDTLPTCLSDRKHDGAIQNYVLHYLGCIEISERKTAYRVNNALYRNEVVNEYRQLIKGSESEQEYRRLIEAGKANEGAWENAERNAEGKVKQWQEACDTELRRIDYLRALLAKDKEVQQLVWDLKLSRAKWEKSEWYIEGLPKVKKWRARHSTSTPGMEIGQTITEDQATTVPEHAVISSSQRSQQPTSSGHHSESSNSGGLSRKADSSSSFAKNGALRRSSMDRTYEELKAYEPDKDFNLHIIEYKDTESREGTVDGNQPVRVKRQLPDRKLKIDKILEKKGTEEDPKTHPLYRTEKPGSLIYIHLPANNMIWAEEAIARYYGEKPPGYDGIYRELQGIDKTHTYMILRPQFWRGQQHGGRSAPPHARHMRPLCNTVSSNPISVDQSPKNIVLFMPYLHWETDRQRNNFALNIEKITENWKKTKKAQKEQEKEERRNHRKDLPKVNFKPRPEEEEKNFWSKAWTYFERIFPPSQPVIPERPLTQKTMNTDQNHSQSSKILLKSNQSTVNGASREEQKAKWLCKWRQHKDRQRPKLSHLDSRVSSFPKLVKTLGYGNKKGLPVKDGRVITKSPLGQFMVDAARLYEEMSNYRDKKLLQKYLHKELPLHPRRTLDQSYYWTLDKTDTRDRDQVVYRGTKSGSFHEYDPKTGIWPTHKEQEITPERGCDECRANIRKISRVIMVDQLWMWILDEQTIITCFPKRYGSNKQETDSSSVHKSIRMRLQNARHNYIRSVFDLALIIIDECSNNFFDRNKTRDRQPQVMDTFSEAIGNVTNKQTAAFERLYRWTKSASKIYRAKGKVGPESISELHVPLLDIYPEGILQREIKDIIEELDIMIDINRSQREVLRDFIMHVEHILDPEGIYGFQNHHRKSKVKFNDNGESSSGHDSKGKGIDRGENKGDGKDDKSQIYDWFKVNADELLGKASKRIEELEVLKWTAQSTSSSVTDLLALKQQQASVVQAWQSVKQSEEAVSQGRSIMMFTVVTIFFLPLSFMASVFGMNATEFGQGDVPLIHEFKYMFPISFVMIIPIFILAFSTWTRALIWFVYKYTMTVTVVKTGMYGYWLNLGLTSRTLVDNAAKETEKLKNKVREERCKLRREERRKEDEDWEKSHNILPSSSSSNDRRSADQVDTIPEPWDVV